MDEQEVMALAGRELDAAVAERVMGWQQERVTTHELQPRLDNFGPGVRSIAYRTPDDRLCFPDEIPAYSSTWEGMGLVVEEMERRGWAWLVDASTESAWSAFERGSVRDCNWQGYGHKAETLPEAVCRAALLALGKGE